mmetsp:Transcript_45136/g.94672  ORF Transcript_45136/g.94672 Transcript_45136/m.94672 type:complete len:409 (+) Transcript_45136:35-1261(+)
MVLIKQDQRQRTTSEVILSVKCIWVGVLVSTSILIIWQLYAFWGGMHHDFAINLNPLDNQNNTNPIDDKKPASSLDDLIVLRGRNDKNSSTLLKQWAVVDWYRNSDEEQESLKFECEFVPYQSYSSKKTAEICIHTDDLVSNQVRKEKRWKGCDNLPALWHSKLLLEKSSNNNVSNSEMQMPGIYLDIGANIGTCVMEMLLSTDAQILAFEPHPMNVYNLKQTILKLGKEYQDRVRLFPIGLGKEASVETSFPVKGNMGNAGIGIKIKDWAYQVWDENLFMKVNIERLDSVLSNNIHVKFAKLDAQGFECNVLEGFGPTLASKIDLLQFEYSNKFLKPRGCHNLLDIVRGYGFDIYNSYENSAVKEQRRHEYRSGGASGVIDNPLKGNIEAGVGECELYAINKLNKTK